MYTDYATLMPRRPSKKPHPRFPFSKDEDAKLKELVNCYGTNWNAISEKMGNRNARQCKERWTNYLSPNVIMKPWTSEEDEFLKNKLAEFGPKWVKISTYFQNRTDIQLKNRWFVLMRKEVKHIPKSEREKGQKNKEKEKQISEFDFSFNTNSNELQIFNDIIENIKWEHDFQN